MRAMMQCAAVGVGVFGLAAVGAGQTPGMPGTPVGKPIVTPVGSPIAKAVPQAGQRVGNGPGGVPPALNPQGPKPAGQVIDLKNVVGPYPQQPNPEPSFWDK